MANAKKTSELILGGVRKQFKEAMDVGKDLAKEWSKSSKIKSASKIKNKAIENAKEIIDDVKIPSFDKWVKGDDLSKAAQSRAPKKLVAATKDAAEATEGIVKEATKKDYSNPVDKSRLKELRKKFANETKDFSRSGSSGYKATGKQAEKIHEKQRKIYANRQYNKEKGRLNYDLENGSLKEKISAKIGLNKLDKQDFMPTTRATKTPGIQLDKNSFAYKAAGLGVGGAIVFSMANNKGQQSNSQLYGQG